MESHIFNVAVCCPLSPDSIKVEGEDDDAEMVAMAAEFERKKAARREQLRLDQLSRQQKAEKEADQPPAKKIKSEADVQRIVSGDFIQSLFHLSRSVPLFAYCFPCSCRLMRVFRPRWLSTRRPQMLRLTHWMSSWTSCWPHARQHLLQMSCRLLLRRPSRRTRRLACLLGT